MGEPLVAPVTASAGSGAPRALSYVSLRSHEGKRVILPVAAAAGSRVLHGLFQGLSVMQLHRSVATTSSCSSAESPQTAHNKAEAGGGDASKSESTAAPESNASTRAEADDATSAKQRGSELASPASVDAGASYRSYAAAFPSNTLCQPPLVANTAAPVVAAGAASSLSSSAGVGGHATQPQQLLLEVPIRSLEASTLARVAEFLVVKCTLATHPHVLHEADVFGDLDRTSERDQLTAMQVLLGADFLNC